MLLNIRWMNNISLLFTAFGVHDSKFVHLSHSGDTNGSQQWNIVPYADNLTMDLAHSRPASQPTVKIYCRANVDYNLTICNDAVMMAQSNPTDKYQHWIKETTYGQHVKDEENRRAFALVNKATGKALKHGFGPRHFVQLAPFDWNCLDVSLLWTESSDLGDGFRVIRMQTNASLALDAYNLTFHGFAFVIVLEKNNNNNQRWKIEEF